MRTPPHNLILSEVDDEAALGPLLQSARSAFDSLPGVIGPKETVVGVVTASGLKDLDKSARETSAEAGVQGTFEDVSRYLTQRFHFNPAQAA